MSPELAYLRFVQIVVSINTILFIISILQVKKGNISLHKKLNSFAVITTLVGVVGLVVTLFLGFDYSTITSKTRLMIHRGFAVPLLPILIVTAYAGWKEKVSLHKKAVKFLMPFWFGTLITGWWFFN